MKIFKKVLLGLIILFVLVSIYVLAKYSYNLIEILNYADTSTQINIVCKKRLGRIWLISYADGEVHVANQRALTYSALNNCVDFFMHFGPHSIDREYFKKHRSILTQPRGAGYWLWKPYIILKTLKQIPENDFIFYVDAGSMIMKPTDSLVEHLGTADILLFKNWHKNKQFIKRDLLKMLNMDNNVVLNALQLQAGYIFIKNTKSARNFIKKWLTLCENEHAITDSPSVVGEYPFFIDHRHDQAILSLLYLQNPKKIVLMEYAKTRKYFMPHRRRTINKSLLLKMLNYKMTAFEKCLNSLMQQSKSITRNLRKVNLSNIHSIFMKTTVQ